MQGGRDRRTSQRERRHYNGKVKTMAKPLEICEIYDEDADWYEGIFSFSSREWDEIDRPGYREPEWWEAHGRPKHLLPDPMALRRAGDPAAYSEAHDRYEAEPIIYLAELGELSEEEIELLSRRGREAADRIGTGAQRGEVIAHDPNVGKSSMVWLGGDRTAAAIGEALRGMVSDG
jgi:hypothetical protein